MSSDLVQAFVVDVTRERRKFYLFRGIAILAAFTDKERSERVGFAPFLLAMWVAC